MKRVIHEGPRRRRTRLHEGDRVRLLSDGSAGTVEAVWTRGVIEHARVLVDGVHVDVRVIECERIPRSVASHGAIAGAPVATLSDAVPAIENPDSRPWVLRDRERDYYGHDGLIVRVLIARGITEYLSVQLIGRKSGRIHAELFGRRENFGLLIADLSAWISADSGGDIAFPVETGRIIAADFGIPLTEFTTPCAALSPTGS